MESSDPQEKLNRSMSEPAKSEDPIATPEPESTPTPEPEPDRAYGPSAHPPESTPTPEPIDANRPSAIPPALLSPIAENAELGGGAETNNITVIVAARSDGETISVHSQRNVIEADGSAHTVSVKTTPEKV
jgi:hypothetical protein